MLAGAVDLDVADDDHLVVAHVEDRGEHVLRALPQARELLRVRPRNSGGRVAQAIALWVLADREQDLSHRALDARQVELLASHAPGVIRRRWARGGRARPRRSQDRYRRS